MKITLLDSCPSYAPIYLGYRECYSPDPAHDIPLPSEEKMGEFIAERIASGHLSPLEHVQLPFSVSGVSRALTHQLVRHRIASYSQKSQRYVKIGHPDYVTPKSIGMITSDTEFNKELEKLYHSFMKLSFDTYGYLLKNGVPAEDARFVLPNACATSIVVTMNCRQLLHFFEERCCYLAQWEIRTMARQMLEICRSQLPAIFRNAGPKCTRLDYCPEEHGCGMRPKRAWAAVKA